MVQRMGSAFTAGQFETGLTQTLEEVSSLLVEHYPATQGERQGKTMVDDAKREVQTVIAAAKEQIAQEKQSMLRELKAEVGTLVVKATAKVLEKVTTKEVDERLIEESLKEVKRQ